MFSPGTEQVSIGNRPSARRSSLIQQACCSPRRHTIDSWGPWYLPFLPYHTVRYSTLGGCRERPVGTVARVPSNTTWTCVVETHLHGRRLWPSLCQLPFPPPWALSAGTNDGDTSTRPGWSSVATRLRKGQRVSLRRLTLPKHWSIVSGERYCRSRRASVRHANSVSRSEGGNETGYAPVMGSASRPKA